MSILMPDTLRYIKRSQLEQEQKIMANYYQDIIRSYGVDVLYIKRDTDFQTSGINSDLIYGHQENLSYSLSSNMIAYMEVDSSMLVLNALGSVPQDELTFYFSINDFAACFATNVGQYAEYPVTTTSGYLPYTINTITGRFTSDVIEGGYSYNTSGAASGFNIHVTPPTSSLSEPSYSILTNPYLHTSFSSTITGGYVSPNLYLYFNKGLYKGFNRTFYVLSGTVLYSDLDLALKHSTKIKPNVGDIVRIDFPGGEQLEEYEINEVFSRRPTTNEGVNPLLGKYIWKCKASRRIASYETIANTDIQNENATEDLMDVIKKTQHDKINTFNEIHDYSNTSDDEVYGGYDAASALVLDPDRYVTSLVLSGSSLIKDFNNNTSLLTDGDDLYFQDEDVYTNITNNVSGNTYNEFNFPISVDNVMYLKIKYGNIYFTDDTIANETKITNYSYINKKEQYSFDYILKNVNSKYNLNNHSSYVFKSDKFALFSNGTNLIAVNSLGEEYIVA